MAPQVETRNDLHLTSTGVGHAFRGELEFPPNGFERTITGGLPPLLNEGQAIIKEDHYRTTTGFAHDYKPFDTTLANTKYFKSPGHWNVGYVEDHIKKLKVQPWRKPLTMGNQSSEMKAQYQAKPGLQMSRYFSSDIQPPVYRHHHTEGPVKQLVASTRNEALAGYLYHVPDRGVLSHHTDMYLTTTQKDHRAFTKEEKSKYPKKEFATYWECEDYTKAWGHGSKDNPLPINSVPREKGPMRDATWFRTPTTIPRRPKSMNPVPNRGLMSEVADNYRSPSADKVRYFNQCPVESPWELKAPGKEEIFSIPKMYKTEYKYYGSGVPVAV